MARVSRPTNSERIEEFCSMMRDHGTVVRARTCSRPWRKHVFLRITFISVFVLPIYRLRRGPAKRSLPYSKQFYKLDGTFLIPKLTFPLITNFAIRLKKRHETCQKSQYVRMKRVLNGEIFQLRYRPFPLSQNNPWVLNIESFPDEITRLHSESWKNANFPVNFFYPLLSSMFPPESLLIAEAVSF